jgi:soluble lytic murein transglycosylase
MTRNEQDPNRVMYPRQFNAYLFGATLALLTLSWSVSACAQDSDGQGNHDKLSSAGDEAKFRVISRFPDREPADVAPLFDTDERPFVDESIRDAIVDEKYDVARLLVQKHAKKKSSKKPSDDPYVELLEAYLAYRAGDSKAALEKLDALAGKVPTLEDYRLYWAAKSAAEQKEHHIAAIRASQVPSDSLLLGSSLILMADALMQAGTSSDTERAIETLELYLAKYPSGRSAEEARLSLGRALEKQALEKPEQWDKAGKAYLKVVEVHALTSSAAEAKTRLDAIKAKLSDDLKKAIDEPSITARMNHYRALYGSHRSETLVTELGAELDQKDFKLEDNKPLRCEALYLVARSYTKLRQHSDGSGWYERVLKECGDTEYALKALYMGGKGYWNSGKQDDARKWFERIWTEYADHSFADDAMYFSARILREEKKADEAKKLLEKQVESYPAGDMAKDAHWLMVRELFAADDHKGVVKYVDGLSQTGEDDLYSRGRLHYFRARALQKLGKIDEAQKGYREVAKANPLSYYAYLAFSRLGQMAQSGQLSEGKRKGGRPGVADLCSLEGGKLCSFVQPSKSTKVTLSDDLREATHFKRGVELLRLGLTPLAEDEFQALRRSHANEANLWALTYLLHVAQAHRISHDLPRRHIQGWKTHYPKSSDDPRWSLAFPQPFKGVVDRFVTKRKLPRALIYAIMREESGFNPRIESWANARGLLQLMEATASNIAEEDKLANFSADMLFEPATNIRLGTGYIAQLSEQLDQHPALVIAGYNGGHANVSRWLKARGDLPLDLWVEDIPYGQTRKYTKRVLASFWTYSWMYGDDRVPQLSFELPSN